jgi:uncharacterized membrane protein YbhN (UPF0104 family)
LSVFRNPLVLAQVVVWTIVQWIASAAAVYFVMLAFDLDVGFDAALFVMVVVSFGFLIPSSPGSIGVYHYLSKRALVGVYAVPAHAALSYAFVAHLLYYVPPIIIGLVFLWHQHLNWQKLRLLTRTADESAMSGRWRSRGCQPFASSAHRSAVRAGQPARCQTGRAP